MGKSIKVQLGDALADLSAATGQLNGAIEELDKLGKRIEVRVSYEPSPSNPDRPVPVIWAGVPQ